MTIENLFLTWTTVGFETPWLVKYLDRATHKYKESAFSSIDAIPRPMQDSEVDWFWMEDDGSVVVELKEEYYEL